MKTWRLESSGQDAYERYIVPAWMGDWAQVLVAAARLAAGERVLDLACGTGIVARNAARIVGAAGRVTGVDLDRDVLEQTARYAAGEGLDGIEWRTADVARLPFASGTYDVVLCQQGLQFFPDRQGAVREMHRVLVPGGRLGVSVWRSVERIPLFAILAHVLGDALQTDGRALFQSSCSLSDREVLRGLFEAAGFRDVHVRLEARVARYPSVAEFLPGYLSVFPVGAALANMDAARRAAMFRRMVDLLEAYADDDGLAAPMESYCVTARK